MVVLGTRPEAIKLAPVVKALRGSGRFDVSVHSTGQHAHMVRPVAELFGMHIDEDFGIMLPNQSLNHIVSATIASMNHSLSRGVPDWCVVQGDTSTTFAAAFAAFNAGSRIAHVEAGLRTGDIRSPWPEEANRVLTTRIADLHFAPTKVAAANLAAEGIKASQVHMVGNTVVDAALMAAAIIPQSDAQLNRRFGPFHDRTVLVTMHRRENLGGPMERALGAVAALADAGAHILFPMHPNPKVRDVARAILGGRPNVVLADPLDYFELIHVLRACRFVITDSGGIVEEAAAFSKPALVLRESTERIESVKAGGALLVGTDPDRILEPALALLKGGPLLDSMSFAPNPFGDGKSAIRIVDIMAESNTRHNAIG